MSVVQLNDELFREVEKIAARSSRPVEAVIEEAVKQLILRKPSNHAGLPTYGGSGLQPGVDIDDSAGLLDIMESDE